MKPVTHLGAITIDVDATQCYADIHGLPAPAQDDPIFTKALPRFFELIERLEVNATLFVVGRDLVRPEAVEAVSAFFKRGDEIASHSFAHDYRLSQKSRADIDADLGRAADEIERVTGQPPVGFRAPGYNLSETLCDAIEAGGYRYDSSLFPTPAYFALRASALLRYRATGQKSQSLVGDVREFAGPRAPFRPAKDARFRPAEKRPARAYTEIPMSTPRLLPWLGTTLAMMPTRAGRAITRQLCRRPEPMVLELHAIDFASPDDGFDPALVAAQPDLSVPLKKKLRRLETAIQTLVERRNVMPLAAFPLS